MATVNLCGWETGDSSEAWFTSGTFSVQNSVARNGGYALRTNPVTTGSGSHTFRALATSGASAYVSVVNSYIRFYFRYATKPASNSEEMFRVVDDTVDELIQKLLLRINSSGNLLAYDSTNSLLATGSTALASDTWYRIEVLCGTGSSASWAVKIDGAAEISGTANLLTTNAGGVYVGKAGNINGNTVDFYFDDLLWSDSGYPGVGRCIALLPSANGNYQTWSIGAGSGSHYQVVDEVPNNGDTDYLLSDLVANDLESEALPNGQVGGAVACVKSVAVYKQNVSGGTVRVLLRSGSTDNVTAADYTATASYVLIAKLYDTDPATSSAWVDTALDSVEVGGKTTSAVLQVRMTFTAVMVDFAPNVGSGAASFSFTAAGGGAYTAAYTPPLPFFVKQAVKRASSF